MAENTKDERIKELEELLRQKIDLIENMEKEIERLKRRLTYEQWKHVDTNFDLEELSKDGRI